MKKMIPGADGSYRTRPEKMLWHMDAVSHLMGGLAPLDQQCFEKKAVEHRHERREK